MDPLKCCPWKINTAKREVPINGQENIDLLMRLFEIRTAEVEPDVLLELNELIENVCVQ